MSEYCFLYLHEVEFSCLIAIRLGIVRVNKKIMDKNILLLNDKIIFRDIIFVHIFSVIDVISSCFFVVELKRGTGINAKQLIRYRCETRKSIILLLLWIISLVYFRFYQLIFICLPF